MIAESKVTSNQLACRAGTFEVTVFLFEDRLSIKAISQLDSKSFAAQIDNKTMNDKLRDEFETCENIFIQLEESVAEKNQPSIEDTGVFKFMYIINAGKKTEKKKEVKIQLKEVQMSETDKLKRKLSVQEQAIGKLEKLVLSHNESIKEISKMSQAPPQRQPVTTQKIYAAPQTKYETISLKLNTTSEFYSKFAVSGNEVNVIFGSTSKWYPLAFTNKLQGNQMFEIEVVDAGSPYFMVGAVTKNLMNTMNCNNDPQSAFLYCNGGFLYAKQKTEWTGYTMKTGDRIYVKYNESECTLEWGLSYPLQIRITKIQLAYAMRVKGVYPALLFSDSCKPPPKIRLA